MVEDLTNRIMAVAFAFLFMFAIFLIILLVWSSPDESINQIRDLAGYLDDHNTTEAKLIITFGGVILVLLATLLIIFELVSPESDTLTVQQVGSGVAEISSEEVVLRVEEELRAAPQIDQVQATIVGRGKKAEVSLSLHVAPEANLANTVEEACRRAAELIEGQMGIVLAKPPSAEVHYRELRVGGQQPPSAAPSTQTAAPSIASPPPADAEPPATESQESTDASREHPPAGS